MKRINSKGRIAVWWTFGFALFFLLFTVSRMLAENAAAVRNPQTASGTQTPINVNIMSASGGPQTVRNEINVNSGGTATPQWEDNSARHVIADMSPTVTPPVWPTVVINVKMAPTPGSNYAVIWDGTNSAGVTNNTRTNAVADTYMMPLVRNFNHQIITAANTWSPNYGYNDPGDGLTSPVLSAGLNIPWLYDGTSAYDRERHNLNATVLSSAARTATTDSADFTNYNARGALFVWAITGVGANPVTFTYQIKDPLSGAYITRLTSAEQAAAVTLTFGVYPGMTVAANLAISEPLATTHRIEIGHSGAAGVTYSVNKIEVR